MDERAQNTIRAIETRYKGYRFRSRLEARWAVVLDHLGIEWEYEPEGYETSAGWYLPDFRIDPRYVEAPEESEPGEFFFEVKGRSLTQDEAERIRAFASDPNEPRWLFALGGIPNPANTDVILEGWGRGLRAHAFFSKGKVCFYRNPVHPMSEWGPTKAGHMGSAFRTQDSGLLDPRGVTRSYFAAGRAARFEHGENGA